MSYRVHEKDTQRRRTVSRRLLAMLHTRNTACNAGAIVHRADSYPACNFRAEMLDPRDAMDIVAFLAPYADHACCDTFSWCHIHMSLIVYLGSSGSLSSSRTILQVYVQRSWLKICVNLLWSRPIQSVKFMIKFIIINYKKHPKASVTLPRTKAHLSDLKML